MKTTLTKLLTAALLLLLTATLTTNAMAYKPTKSLLETKGYSPLMAELINVQAKRQEWKQPPPRRRTPQEQIERNIYINDWMGNMDPFGRYIIRERQ